MVQSLWKRVGKIPIELNINLPLRPSNSIPRYLRKRNENMSIYMNCRKAKIIVTKSRLAIAWGRGQLTANEKRGCFREERNILYLECGCVIVI